MPKLLVYTCVFRNFDRIFPPVTRDSAIDYVVVTDDPDLQVSGWRSHVVDISAFDSPRIANRYYKILGHGVFGSYDASVYVDGNIRVIGRTKDYLHTFLSSGAAFGGYRHPTRQSVQEEVGQCAKRGQVSSLEVAQAELDAYRSEGFPDSDGLIEAGIIMKNHKHPALENAMGLWWSLFDRFRMRDQFSLPFVVWRTGLPCYLVETSYRTPNPHFGQYPHLNSGGASRSYVYLRARSYDSPFYSALLQIWHAKWEVQRHLRALGD